MLRLPCAPCRVAAAHRKGEEASIWEVGLFTLIWSMDPHLVWGQWKIWVACTGVPALACSYCCSVLRWTYSDQWQLECLLLMRCCVGPGHNFMIWQTQATCWKLCFFPLLCSLAPTWPSAASVTVAAGLHWLPALRIYCSPLITSHLSKLHPRPPWPPSWLWCALPFGEEESCKPW